MLPWGLRWHFRNRSVTAAPYNIKVTVCHTAGHYGEEYDDWNSDVFRSRRNCSSDGAERTEGGRAFHARAAATGKARSFNVVRRVDGITSVDAEALQRPRREPVRWMVSVRYDGAVPLKQRHARTHNRNWILSGTFGHRFSPYPRCHIANSKKRHAPALPWQRPAIDKPVSAISAAARSHYDSRPC